MKYSGNAPVFRISKHLTRFAVSIVTTVLAAQYACADAPAPTATIRRDGTDFEGRRIFSIDWIAQSNTTYILQARDGFSTNDAWQTFDAQQLGPYRLTENAGAAEEFFRVLAPQPQIGAIEPALLGTEGGTAYLLGQCLGSNVSLRIGGLVLAPNTLQPGSVYTFNVIAGSLGEGTYDVEVLNGTNVVAVASKAFSISSQIVFGAGQQRLLEVPAEPPASPALMKAKEKANRTKCAPTERLRTLPATGELQLQETDLFVPGRGLDFQWTRTYRSRTGSNTVMGQGWTHSYDIRAVSSSNAVTIFDGTGRSDAYYIAYVDGAIFATANELFNVGVFTNGIFWLIFPDGGRWEFSHPAAPEGGKLLALVDRLGDTMRFSYDTNGRLSTIRDTLGRTNAIAYDGTGRILSVTDFSGRSVTYSYYRNGQPDGGNGDLRSVTTPPVVGTPTGNDFPQGKTTIYTYSTGLSDPRLNHNLLTITDPAGQTWFSAEYYATTNGTDVTFDRILSTQRGGFSMPRTFISYTPLVPSPNNRWAVMKAVVNDPVGNVTIDWFDSLNRGIVHRDIAARATPNTLISQTNLPSKKLRDTDPDFWDTHYEWNADSLCTLVTYPRGNSTSFLYQRAFNQNASRSNHTRRSDGNPRVVRELACCGGADTDGDGQSDVSELIWRMEFDPRFGSPAMLCSAGQAWAFPSGPRQSTSLDSSRMRQSEQVPRVIVRGWDPTKKNASRRLKTKETDAYQPWDNDDLDDGVVSNPLYEGGGNTGENPLFEKSDFVVRAVDPRGNVDTAAFNQRGLPVTFSHAGSASDGSDKPVTNLEYNQQSQLSAIVYPENGTKFRRRDQFNYSLQTGMLTEWITDATGSTSSTNRFSHDARGNVTQIVDARGNTNQFIFNSLDQCVRSIEAPVCNPCPGIATDYKFDANDNLIETSRERRDKDGIINANDPAWLTTSTYDSLNRRTLLAHELTHTVQQRSATNKFVYDPNDNVIEQHSPEAVNGNQPGNFVRFEYDTRQLLFRRSHGNGIPEMTTNQWDYNENGFVVRATDRAGNEDSNLRITSYEYDGFGRRSAVTDAMGNVSRFGYDNNHNLIYERHFGETNDVTGDKSNLRLAETRYDYDSLNRRAHTRVSFFDVFTGVPLLDGESTTTFSYAPNGACRSTTDDNGNVTQYSHDSRGRLAAITDTKTNIVSYLYDANDNVTAVTQNDSSDVAVTRQSFITSFQYDALNRCVLDYDNVGNTNRYFYDSAHNRTHQQDARGNWRRWQYDGLSRVILIEADLDGDGDFEVSDITTTQVWDDNSRLVAVVDDNTNTTRYVYDSVNRLVATTNADNTVASLIWSPRSNLARSSDPNGTVTQFTYDELNRCTRKNIVAGAGVSTATTFEWFAYDGMSRMVLASNDASMIEFSYDSMGNVAKQKQDCIAAFLTHDGMGNETSMTYPNGRFVQRSYDSLNRPSSVSSSGDIRVPATVLETFAYEGANRLTRITRNNGINTRIFFNGDSKIPNTPGDFGWQQVVQINHQIAGGGSTIDRRGYAYDRSQNKTVRKQLTPFTPPVPSRTNTWSYDAMARLHDEASANVRGSGSTARSYQMDGQGNREQVIEDGSVMNYTRVATLPEPADFQMDQYSGTPVGSREYDRNGNLIYVPGPAGGTQFAYDYANRLVSVSRSVGPASVPIATFTYDCFGRRLSKTIYPPAPASQDTTVFYYVGNDMIQARDGASGTTRHTIVYPHVLDTSGRIFFAGGAPLYLITDELGNTLALTDALGNITERFDYDDFGLPEFLAANGTPLLSNGVAVTSSPMGNPYLFQGMFWDNEIGLYARDGKRTKADAGRYLDPKSGRYLSRGAATGGGANAFTFQGDNPWSGGTDAAMPPGDWYVWKVRSRAQSGIGDSGGLPSCVYFNPKEYTLDKSVPWQTKKEEGGRHTPFHNKYRPSSKVELMFNPREYSVRRFKAGAELAGSVNKRTTFAVLLGHGSGTCGDEMECLGEGGFGQVFGGRWGKCVSTDSGFRKILDLGEAGDNVSVARKDGQYCGHTSHF